MRRFILGRELPAIFALALAGAVAAVANHQVAGALWLVAAALWALALWLILFIGGKHESR